MDDLIRELSKEHAGINATLDRIAAVGAGSREGREMLRAMKAGLLDHLAREDEELYPVMHRAAEEDDGFRRTLAVFASGMPDVTKSARRFFDRCERGGRDLDLPLEFGRLFLMLKNRMQREESLIFPAFERRRSEDKHRASRWSSASGE
jgi:hemerythrin superfamily protein